MRALRLVVGLAAASLALSVVPAHAAPADRRPVHAIGTATTTIPDVVFYGDDCYEFPVLYTVASDAYSPESWTLKFDVLRPDGDLSTFDGIYSTRSAPAARTGRSTFQLCEGLDAPGTYTAKFRLTTESRTALDVTEFQTQFLVRAPSTETTLVLPSKITVKKKTRATVTVRAETPSGLLPAPGRQVALQYQHGHRPWKTAKNATGRTDGTGSATVTFKAPAKGRVTYRALTAASGAYPAAPSTTVTRRG